MFEYTKAPRDITKYTLMRGVTDFSDLTQYNLYETGYAFLVLVNIPKYLEKLADRNSNYKTLIDNYKHILEYEFRNIDGLEDITVDPGELTNGISSIQIINKVNEQSGSTFTMRYFEKSGSTITKVHELFLKGLKDSRTQIKHYHGLIEDGILEAGYENETFNFLYFVTDNTARQIERAYYITSAQPQTAETSIYEYEKGTIEFKEISVTMSGYPITGDLINKKAQEILDWMNNPSNPKKLTSDSNDFHYQAIDRIRVE